VRESLRNRLNMDCEGVCEVMACCDDERAV